jgi:hypothetical protein
VDVGGRFGGRRGVLRLLLRRRHGWGVDLRWVF